MTINITSVGNNPSKHWAACIYSPPGKGKTRFVGSGENVLIIRPPTDHTDSIRGGAGRNVREVVVHGWDDMDAVYRHLEDEGEQYDVVAFDSISLFQDTGLDDLWSQVLAEKPQRKRYGLDKAEYGINMHRLGLWVRGVIGLDKFNFVVTAHAFWGTNLDDEDLLMPWVQGRNMPEKICGMVNMVGYMEVRKLKLDGEDKPKTRRVINFSSSERFYAKDQFDAFPKGRLVDPTMENFTAAIDAARAREAAAAKGSVGKKTTSSRKQSGKKGK